MIDDLTISPRYAEAGTRSAKDTIVTSQDVWAAAAYAQRINGAYLKNPVFSTEPMPTKTKDTSRNVMLESLKNLTVLTEDDYQVGSAALEWHNKKLTYKSLVNQLSDFDRSLINACRARDFSLESDRAFIAIICSQIQAYQNGVRVDEAQAKVNHSAPILGEVGAKITHKVEIVSGVYSKNYNVYFLNALTDTNQMVLFSYRERLVPGSVHTIRGTVKGFKGDVCQLNRVKKID